MSTRTHPIHRVTIAGLDVDRCHETSAGVVRIYFRLSRQPPPGWCFTFIQVWKQMQYPNKPQAGADPEGLWIECQPQELAGTHLERFQEAMERANQSYAAAAAGRTERLTRDAARQERLRASLEEISLTLYPPPARRPGDESRPRFRARAWAMWLRRVLGGSGTRPSPSPSQFK